MSCGISCVKYLLFIFNFIFTLLGLLILGVGIWSYVELGSLTSIESIQSTPTIVFIVLGAVIFIVAFFGCCGAIRESHCMVVTFAVFLLTILIVQIAVGVWAFILGKNIDSSEVTSGYRSVFNNYWTREADRVVVDGVQTFLECCGVTASNDFNNLGNGTVPWSCCGNEIGNACTSNIYTHGCSGLIIDLFQSLTKIIGGVAIGVAVTELIGIIFALCLANSIRNDDRRGYRV